MLEYIRKIAALVATSLLLVSTVAQAQVLSDRAIYQRCYSKLVRMAPGSDDPFIPMITAGTLTGPAACKALVNLAIFGTNGRVPAYAAQPVKFELAKRVLTAMNDFHSSWFANKDWEASTNARGTGAKSIIDTQEPAYYLTRAMFDTDKNFLSILTGTENLRALRSENNPSRSIYSSLVTPAGYETFTGNVRLIGNGELLGIGLESPATAPLRARALINGETGVATLPSGNVRRSLGGGIIGAQSYILNNFGDDPDLHTTVASMPRTWSKYIFKDFFCRDLPVIGVNDGAKFEVCKPSAGRTCAIVPSNADAPKVLAFRADKACTQCHASMDQLGGLVRGLRSWTSGPSNNQSLKFATLNVYPQASTLPLVKTWPYLEELNYNKRVPYGRLFYRNYRNDLINVELNGLNELASALKGADDFYICAAKRYFEYFTGIDVNVSPMTVAQENTLLSPGEKYYRNLVINQLALGTNGLKTTKNSMTLVEAIFKLPEYKQKDFGLIQRAGQ